MFRWNTPKVNKIFRLKDELFAKNPLSKAMASNQGLYNGFLATGAMWSLVAENYMNRQLALYFTSCVAVAAIYGAVTVTPRILYIQGIPAFMAIICILVGI